MDYKSDKRTVMTLDAGGTNFVFNAMQGCNSILEDIKISSNADDLEKCLKGIIWGFDEIKKQLEDEPVAISFAFPGPADYPNGIIGDLPNLPAFKGGVALGPMLQERFNLPVFINNDGDLYAYGEAIAGVLPEINSKLEEAGSPKRYKNLLGLTLGTGFGGGIVINDELLIGDNSIASEIWLSRNKLNPNCNIETHASIRGLIGLYNKYAGTKNTEITPKDIFEIAKGLKEGNKSAAENAFYEMAEAVGDSISNVITMVDGIVVIGGGLSGASEIFLPKVVDEMNSNFVNSDGSEFKRLVSNVYDLENGDIQYFIHGNKKTITIPFSNKQINYDPQARIGIAISKIGTSNAISIGAYAYALNKLDKS